ncbi:MAG TPA: MFS transporter [Acidimicrobiales bacterium]|nr:MFS transporter [Acidimicrobiales bacterium]
MTAPAHANGRGAHNAEEETALDEIEQTRDELRSAARSALGVEGTGEGEPEKLNTILKRHGVSRYPLVTISLLAVIDTLHGWGFVVLAPEISSSFGLSVGAVAAVLTLKNFAHAVAPLPAAALTRKPRRALLAVGNAIGFSLAGTATAFVTGVWGLLGVGTIDGLTSGASQALHTPLMMDSHPPSARVRALTVYQVGLQAANVIAPLLVAILTGWFYLSWRGVFLVTGLLSLVVSLSAIRLRDPGFGRYDERAIRQAVHERHGEAGDDVEHDETLTLGFFEIVRRLLLIRTVRRLLGAASVIGALTAPFLTFLFFFLDERWGMGPSERGIFLACVFALSIGALALFGKRGEAMFREDPAQVVRTAGALMAVAVVTICIAALMPVFLVMAALFGLAFGLIAIITPSLNVTAQTLVAAPMRAHQSALTGMATAAGSIVGLLFFSGIERRYGIGGSLVAVMGPGLIGSAMIASAARTVGSDFDRAVDAVLEDEEISRIRRSGGHLPMLSCRGIDFSYGKLQVLFDVDFTVDEGEMVALLGVNGAGKSTLLKVISGIGLPHAGSVRFGGHEITYLDAERRVGLGITQVPGGRAIFPGMSVAENLRTYGYTLGRRKQGLEEGIELCFATFPRLQERRDQNASTLSGGEQQMLGLSKALILQPRLLLIDELSLGLAPVVVGPLLDLVRRINAGGTAVVLVEQSVNIALGLVDHAYFMEKGEMRFDGSSADLLSRGDLLRAVFLSGAAPEGAK